MIQTEQVADCIDVYVRRKNELTKVLEEDGSSVRDAWNNALERAEKELEEAFAEVLAIKAEGVADVLAKAELFISEILSEAELAQFQTKALQSIVDDLRVLNGKTYT